MKKEKRTVYRRKKVDEIYGGVVLSLSILCLLIPQGFSWAASTSGPPGNPSEWVMTFSDEFDGTSLDLSKWATTYAGGGRTNNDELEWYVDNAQIVSNGTLKLVAKHESAHSGFSYTSGMISEGRGTLVQTQISSRVLGNRYLLLHQRPPPLHRH